MYNTRSLEDVSTFYSRADTIKKILLSVISERNKLDLQIRQSKTLITFRNVLKTGRPISKSV